MTLDSQLLVLEPLKADPAHGVDSEPGRLRVTVVFTTIPGTLAALETATRLARNLNAEIVLLVAEVIYFRYLLEQPPVSPVFFENLCLALIDELDAGLPPSTISASTIPACRIEVRFCRDQLQCLQLALRPRSLVVLGASRRWWNSRERRLERALRDLGHSVLLVRANWESGEARAQSVVSRMLAYVTAQTC